MTEETLKAARFQNKTANIAAGQALSNVVDCSSGQPIAVYLPDDWTPARLTFQISPDGTNFGDLFDASATEVAFNILPGTALILAPQWTPIMYLKVRSGSRENPVVQDADRGIIITIDSAI
jgi:hypothetical protein